MSLLSTSADSSVAAAAAAAVVAAAAVAEDAAVSGVGRPRFGAFEPHTCEQQ